MPIKDVRLTSSPAYTVHSVCQTSGISYARLSKNTKTISKFGVKTLRNSLAYVDSLAVLFSLEDSLIESKNDWCVVVNGSEQEASEIGCAYAESVNGMWLASGLSSATDFRLVRTKKKTNVNVTYLSPIITELYKIVPKDKRPVTQVFRYLAGIDKSLDVSFPEKLQTYLKQAKPLRQAIESLKKDFKIENVRKIAKERKIDVFEINYVIAKALSK